MRLDCKNYGLTKETEVSFDGRRLVTQGLGIRTLCRLWRWYYNIPPFEQIFLAVPKRLFSASEQRTLSSSKSVKELFEQEGIEMICKEDTNDGVRIN